MFPDWRHPFKETDTDLIPEGWKYEKPAGAADSEIVNESGDIGFFPSPNSELYTKDAISNPYVWVMRTRLSAGKVAQYIVRATHEKINNVRFTDPDGTKITYKDDDGNDVEKDVLGSSGISFRPHGTSVYIFIKQYDPSAPKKLNNKVVKIDYVANFIFPRGEYQDVAVVDDGKSVTIYFGDELVAKISFSEKKKYDISNEEFYSKATVTGKNGSVLANVDNALISTKSVLCIAANDIIGVGEIGYTEYKIESNPQTGDTAAFMAIGLVALLGMAVLKKRPIEE